MEQLTGTLAAKYTVPKVSIEFERKMEALQRKMESIRVDHSRAKHRLGFLYASSNVDQLFPNAVLDTKELYREVLYNVNCAQLERKCLASIENSIRTVGESVLLRNAGKTGMIFCNFHLGSFYAGLQVVARLGLPLTVAISPVAYRKMGTQIEKDVSRFCRRTGYRLDFELIDMGERSSLLLMARQIKAGRNVAIFVDASFGNCTSPGDQEGLELSFLEGKIKVRTGAAELSYLTGAKMIPVVSRREKNGILSVTFHTPIVPKSSMSRKEFGWSATSRLFSLLEKSVLKSPEQWEGWLYCHDFVIKKQVKGDGPKTGMRMMGKEGPFRMNTRRYAFVDIKGEHWLFDRYSYRMVKLWISVYRLLKSQPADALDPVKPNDLFFLFENQVLIDDN